MKFIMEEQHFQIKQKEEKKRGKRGKKDGSNIGNKVNLSSCSEARLVSLQW